MIGSDNLDTRAATRTACMLALSLAARSADAAARSDGDARHQRSGRLVTASPASGICVVDTGARTHTLLLTSDAVVFANDRPLALGALRPGDVVQWEGAGTAMDVVDALVVRSRDAR